MGQRAMKCYHSRSICFGSLISVVRLIGISMHARAHMHMRMRTAPPLHAYAPAPAGMGRFRPPMHACL